MNGGEGDPVSSGDWQRRAARGLVALMVCDGVIRGLALVSHVVLARLLSPEVLGAFAVIVFAVGLFDAIGELGLSGALVQRREPLTVADQRTAFTLQALIEGASVVLIWLVAPTLVAVYQLPPQTVPLFRWLSLSLLISTLALIPEARLERELDYRRLSLAGALRAAAYHAIAMGLALAGFGIWSLGLAFLISVTVGTGVLWAFAPWRPGWGWDRASARWLTRFGGPFQVQRLVHLAKDNVGPALGVVYGARAVGYLSFAGRLATLSAAPAALVNRISFATYARVQDDRAAMGTTLELAVRWTALLSFPLIALLCGLGRPIVHLIYTDKWLPALPALYLLCAEAVFGVFTTLLMPVLQATGRLSTALRLSLVWTGLTWALALVLAWSPLGFVGVAVAYALSTPLAALLLVRQIRTVAPVRLLPNAGPAAAAAVAAGVVMALIAGRLGEGLAVLAVAAAAGLAVYAGLVTWWQGRRLLADARELRR
jgi:teichuronic acid exporter